MSRPLQVVAPIDCTANDIDIDVVESTRFVRASWTVFSDYESGVAEYEYCVGSRYRLCDLLPFEPIGNSTSVQVELGNSTRHGDERCVSVRAINGVGLTSAMVSSDCVTTDATPPSIRSVSFGLDAAAHLESQQSTELVFAVLMGVEDYSTITLAGWCLSSSAAPGTHARDAPPDCDLVAEKTDRVDPNTQASPNPNPKPLYAGEL